MLASKSTFPQNKQHLIYVNLEVENEELCKLLSLDSNMCVKE
jgi:hypothetical protein